MNFSSTKRTGALSAAASNALADSPDDPIPVDPAALTIAPAKPIEQGKPNLNLSALERLPEGPATVLADLLRAKELAAPVQTSTTLHVLLTPEVTRRRIEESVALWEARSGEEIDHVVRKLSQGWTKANLIELCDDRASDRVRAMQGFWQPGNRKAVNAELVQD